MEHIEELLMRKCIGSSFFVMTIGTNLKLDKSMEANIMAFKKFRNMKVYEQSGYNYKAIPTIMMKGEWLREIGFDCGTGIMVECEDGKLTITKVKPEENVYSEEMKATALSKVAEEKKAYGKRGRK